MKPSVIIFDLNGTLLDMAALDPHFARIFDKPGRRERWFEHLQTLWMTTIATGAYEPFDKLAKAALKVLAAKEAVELEAADESAVLNQMIELPPYPDVQEALTSLHAGGYRLIALTNGTQKSAKAQLNFAKLEGLFENVFSADQVARYKPAPEPYRYAAEQVDERIGRVLLVAAHAWDIAGAYEAGSQTAFVARPGQVLNPSATRPDYAVANLIELANQLL